MCWMFKIGKLSLVTTSLKQKTTTNTSVSVNNLDQGFNQKEYQ